MPSIQCALLRLEAEKWNINTNVVRPLSQIHSVNYTFEHKGLGNKVLLEVSQANIYFFLEKETSRGLGYSYKSKN